MKKLNLPHLPTIFNWLWAGQTISIFGSRMTTLALAIWVFERTGSLSDLSALALCGSLPSLLSAPGAGLIADLRPNTHFLRASNLFAAALTGMFALRILFGTPCTWEAYLLAALYSILQTSVQIAFGTVLPSVVSRENLGYANGRLQTSAAISQIGSPLAGGILFSVLGLRCILFLDCATFLFAAFTAWRLTRAVSTAPAKHALPKELFAGLRILSTHPGLRAMLILFSLVNFSTGVVTNLIRPLVLTTAGTAQLGTVLAVAGAGMLTGSLLNAGWQPRLCRTTLITLALFIAGLSVVAAGFAASVTAIAMAGFAFMFALPFVTSSVATIWQIVVPQEFLGRCMAAGAAIGSLWIPVAQAVSGPLVEHYTTPLRRVARLCLPSPELAGREIGVTFVLMGALCALTSLGAYAYRPWRALELSVARPSEASESASIVDSKPFSRPASVTN